MGNVPLVLKLVSVKFSGLPLALPTLSLAFWRLVNMLSVGDIWREEDGGTWKSFCFSFFFLALEPIV